jgi:hypothetical protein
MGAAGKYPEEITHAGRWERRAEIAHDQTRERDKVWAAQRQAAAVEKSAADAAGVYERVPRSVDAGVGGGGVGDGVESLYGRIIKSGGGRGGGNPYRNQPVDFVGRDGVRVGSDGCCPPSHSTHFVPHFTVSYGIL